MKQSLLINVSEFWGIMWCLDVTVTNHYTGNNKTFTGMFTVGKVVGDKEAAKAHFLATNTDIDSLLDGINPNPKIWVETVKQETI